MKMTARKSACLSYMGQALFMLLLLAAIAFIGLPMVALLWRSWQDHAWKNTFDERLIHALLLTFETTAYSLIIIILLGTPLAYILARWQFWGKRLINVMVELPIVMPPAVAGLGLLMAFGRRGMVGTVLYDEFGLRLAFTQEAVVLAQTFVAMPFYTRSAQLGFSGVDTEIENAALVDGASPFWRFVFVTLPLSWRAVLAGLLMSWARAIGEFGATILFAGSVSGRTQTMTLLIYNIFEQDIGAAVWTALLLIVLAALIILVTQLLVKQSS